MFGRHSHSIHTCTNIMIIKLSSQFIATAMPNSNLITIFFLFLIPPLSSQLSFNLSGIGPWAGSSINVTGDAYVTPQGIQVTPNERGMALGGKIGRATYSQPLHLWDKASAQLTDFSTHFSFVIDSNGSRYHGDGLAFFLAPLNSSIQPWMGGYGLGLGNSTLGYPFVAVEFDTYSNNPWDPNYGSPYEPHAGIDINSLESVTTAPWDHNIAQGVESEAWIYYNSSSMMLWVDYSINTTQRGNVSYVVDLRKYLPEYVVFGFSATTGDLFEKHNVKSWDFSSTLLIDVPSPSPSPSPEPTVNTTGPAPEPPLGPKNSKKNKGLVAGLSASAGLSILILASAYVLCRKNKWCKKKKSGDSFGSALEDELEEGIGPKRFPYRELVLATNSFAEDNKLGEGGFGGVYRGLLRETSTLVAVKKVSKGSKQGAKEYASEIKVISQLRHRNLVQLLGWCHERGDLLLVYEYMPNGSLDSRLFKQTRPLLAWRVRYKIVQGLASALMYLHEGWERCVVHRDIKASNIMMDSHFNAKLGDFGLARLVDHEKGSQTTLLAGTMGYLAPECAVTGRASKESDVYSFGILLIEIACGRRAIDLKLFENQVLVEWVWGLYGVGQLLDAADPKLEDKYDAREMEEVMIVGLWCVHPDSGQRPSMRQVIQVVNSESQLPTLPSIMPVPTYDV